MSGWIKLHRGWMDNPALTTPERKVAWLWLIENACWKETKVDIKGRTETLQRGQMTFSIRFLADAWGWSKTSVERFLGRLKTETMIDTANGTGQNVITICNYFKYQDSDEDSGTASGTQSGTGAGQERDKEEEGKKLRKKETTTTGLAFVGRVIRLNQADYDNCAKTFHAIPDLKAELTGLDAWLDGQSEAKRKGWFHSVAGNLSRKHQEHIAAEKPKPPPVIRAPLRTEAPC